VALSCERGHAPGQVLHALQELREVIDVRLRDGPGGRYDGHTAQSVGTDKLTVTFTLRAPTHADAIRSAGPAAGTHDPGRSAGRALAGGLRHGEAQSLGGDDGIRA
jgi:hypothetical protein